MLRSVNTSLFIFDNVVCNYVTDSAFRNDHSKIRKRWLRWYSELHLSLAAAIALSAVSWYVTLVELHDYVFGAWYGSLMIFTLLSLSSIKPLRDVDKIQNQSAEMT